MSSIIGTRIRRESRTDRPRLPSSIPAAPPFYYMTHPFSWWFHQEGDGAGEWLPSLLRMVVDPGVNGVRQDRSTTPARTMATERGCTVIEYSDPRLGTWQDYVQVFETRNGRRVHRSMFESVRVIAGRVRWRQDRDEYIAFLRHLIDSGVVAPIDPDVVDELTSRERNKLSRLHQRSVRNPADTSLKARVDSQSARIDAMLSADAVRSPVPTEPKKRRRKTKVATEAEA